MRSLPFFLLLAIPLLALPLLPGDEGTIQCANLIYGGTHTSRCFSDEFLSAVQRQTTIPTERRFKSVKLGSDELFKYPFIVMTGEASFHLSAEERKNLRTYLEKGGFLLASAGCSSKEWDQCFRRELTAAFEKNPLIRIPMTHPVFATVKKIQALDTHHTAADVALEGIEINGKVAAIYSSQGLNDTAHTAGCCCCGGNEIKNSLEMMVNIFVYALLH